MIKFLFLSFKLLIDFVVFNKYYIVFAVVAMFTYILIDIVLSLKGMNTPIKKLYKIIK